jgi:hypothetical protein
VELIRERAVVHTTTKSICGVGWKPIFCIGSSNRYDLYDTKNEWFIVSIFENKKTVEPRPRLIGPRSRLCRYSRRRHRRARRRLSPHPDPCPPSLGCRRRGPPSREGLCRRRLRLNVKDGGRCPTTVARLASTVAPPRASVVVTVIVKPSLPPPPARSWPSSRSWPPSTAAPPQASVVVAVVAKPLASLHCRHAPGLPPPPLRAWSPSTAMPPQASVVVASERGRSERKEREVDEIKERARGNKGNASACERK